MYRDREASKENPSSSTHAVSVTHKARLPTVIPVVCSLVGLNKDEKASYRVVHKPQKDHKFPDL